MSIHTRRRRFNLAGTLAVALAACLLPTGAQAGLIDLDIHWNNNEVRYFYKSSINSGLRGKIERVLRYVEDFTSLDFDERANGGANKLKFEKTDLIDTVARFVQTTKTIKIKVPSVAETTLLHEIGHAIGLDHEQQRPDRATWVQFLLNRVDPGKAGNYAIPTTQSLTVGSFDFNSLMLYGSCSYALGWDSEPDVTGLSAACRAGLANGASGATLATAIASAPMLRLNDPTTGGVNVFRVNQRRFSSTDLQTIHTHYAAATIVDQPLFIFGQPDADAFCATNPNVIVVGGVFIDGSDSIALPCVERVVGHLVVNQFFTGDAVSVPNLLSVAGSLTVDQDAALTTLHLPQLRAVESADLAGEDMDDLQIPALRSVYGTLRIRNSALLTIFLPVLDVVESLWLESNDVLVAFSAPAITQLWHSGLSVKKESCAEANGSGCLVVERNDALMTLDLSALVRLRTARFDDNDALELLDLSTLAIAHDVQVDGHAALEYIALNDLGRYADPAGGGGFVPATVPSLSVTDNPALTDLFVPKMVAAQDIDTVRNGSVDAIWSLVMPALTEVIGSVTIVANEGLSEVDLPVVDTISGGLAITMNPRLSAAVAPKLIAVDMQVNVRDNAGLLDLSLSSLEHVGATLFVRENAALPELSLPALETTGWIIVSENAALDEIELGPISESDADLWVTLNPVLTALTGGVRELRTLRVVENGLGLISPDRLDIELEDLSVLAGDFIIEDNARLFDFDHLRSPTGVLMSVAGDFTVTGNGQLAAQAAAQLSGELSPSGIGGAVTITP